MSYQPPNIVTPVTSHVPLELCNGSNGIEQTAISATETWTSGTIKTFHESVLVSCYVDADATFFLDLSTDDGENFDSTISKQLSAGVNEFSTSVKGSRTVRVRITAGSSDVTVIRSHVEFGTFRQANSPLNATLQSDSDAATVRATDARIDAALGRFRGIAPVNKFGRAPAGVQVTATDIWDRADATPTQQIWTAPTQARVHAIVSTSTADTNSSGAGARTISVFGLTAWDAAETSEVVTLTGQTPVNTVNSYVIIHRMRVVTCGGTGPNVGTITATAATDGTVTAAIRPTIGSTAMAIYGVPEGKSLLLSDWWANIRDSSGAASDALVRLFYNPDPENYPTLYIERDARGLQSDGTASDVWPYESYKTFPGPGIIKVNCIASTADIDMTAGFDGIVVDDA